MQIIEPLESPYFLLRLFIQEANLEVSLVEVLGHLPWGRYQAGQADDSLVRVTKVRWCMPQHTIKTPSGLLCLDLRMIDLRTGIFYWT